RDRHEARRAKKHPHSALRSNLRWGNPASAYRKILSPLAPPHLSVALGHAPRFRAAAGRGAAAAIALCVGPGFLLIRRGAIRYSVPAIHPSGFAFFWSATLFRRFVLLVF